MFILLTRYSFSCRMISGVWRSRTRSLECSRCVQMLRNSLFSFNCWAFAVRSPCSWCYSPQCGRLPNAMCGSSKKTVFGLPAYPRDSFLHVGSNDSVKSTIHRVRAPQLVKTDVIPDRYSIPYVSFSSHIRKASQTDISLQVLLRSRVSFLQFQVQH